MIPITKFLRIIGWILLLTAALAAIGAASSAYRSTGSDFLTLLAAAIAFANMAFLAAAGFVLANIADHITGGPIQDSTSELTDPSDPDIPPLGMSVKPEATGLLIETVEYGSPAGTAGIRPDDYITHINGAALAYLPTLASRVKALTGSSRLLLTVQRSESTTQITLR